jgi:enoyl-CoA hydratase/carnithine racemase
VNGYAMGGGCEIALACHLVVADTTARFALSEVKVGPSKVEQAIQFFATLADGTEQPFHFRCL